MSRIQLRRGTAAEWAAANPILAPAEPGFETDTGKEKIGNGISTWTALPYGPGGFVAQGDLVLNVKDYGAVGDGINDDTVAIQAAISSLPLNTSNIGILTPIGFANGGAVYIPHGRYKVTSTLTLQRGLRLYGDSRESSQIISFTAGSVLQYLDAGRAIQDEIVIENLSIFQDASVVASSGALVDVYFGPAATKSTNLICRNMLVMGGYRGIRLAAAVWSSIDNCFIANAVSHGVEIVHDDGAFAIPSTSTTIKNCYASGCGGAGFYITGGAYLSFVGTASDSNATYGYHLVGGDAYSMLACGAEENMLGGAYLKNTSGAVLNLQVIHTLAGVRHGVSLEACNKTTILGGKYIATTATGYGIHVVTNAGPITCIGAVFQDNYAANVCDSPQRFLNMTDADGFTGSANHWSIGVDGAPDTTATFQVGGVAASSTGLRADPTFNSAPSGVNSASLVIAKTDNTAITYPLIHGLEVRNVVKGAASTVTRSSGITVNEQTQGGTANANLYINAGGAIPVGNWSVYSASTRDSLFLGPIRTGSSIGPTWSSGAGSPEGVVTAPVGSLFSRTDGGTGTSLYVKQTGTGNTGWIGK